MCEIQTRRELVSFAADYVMLIIAIIDNGSNYVAVIGFVRFEL